MEDRVMPGRTGGSSSSSSGGSSGSFHSNSSSSYHSSYHSYPSGGSGTGQWNPWSIVWIIIVIGFWLWVTSSRGANNSTGYIPPTDNNTAIAATTSADIAIMTKSLGNKIPRWEETTDSLVHHVSGEAAGLPSDFNTKEVVYGQCTGQKFYMFVLNQNPGTNLGIADSSGYAYTPGSNPQTCAPDKWLMTTTEDDGGGWYYVTFVGQASTLVALTQTPHPTLPSTVTPTP
jgi:hypothetical protein